MATSLFGGAQDLIEKGFRLAIFRAADLSWPQAKVAFIISH
jgi:hypothetical protein